MRVSGLSEAECDELEKAIRSVEQVERVVLFGSRAKGTAKRGSDVDLALWGKPLDHAALLELSTILNEETFLPYRFDLVDFQTIDNQALKEHIERVGIVLYERE